MKQRLLDEELLIEKLHNTIIKGRNIWVVGRKIVDHTMMYLRVLTVIKNCRKISRKDLWLKKSPDFFRHQSIAYPPFLYVKHENQHDPYYIRSIKCDGASVFDQLGNSREYGRYAQAQNDGDHHNNVFKRAHNLFKIILN